MPHTFVIYSEKDKPDSLKDTIWLALAITPAESKLPTCPIIPMAFTRLRFQANVDDVSPVEWASDNYFDTYVVENQGGRKVASLEGRHSDIVKPAYSVTLNGLDWSTPVPYANIVAFKQRSIIAKNGAGSARQIALCTQVTHSWSTGRTIVPRPIIAYNVLKNGEQIVIPTALKLQVYVIGESINYSTFLSPGDLRRALFAEPLDCASLPSFSAWRLSQNSNGVVQLRNDDQAEMGRSSGAESISEMRSQLSAMQQSLNDGLMRIEAAERSVTRTRDDFTSSQQAIADIRQSLHTMEKTAIATKTNAEAKAARLEKSFGQTQEYLSSVQKFLQTMRNQLVALDQSVPAIEAKTDKLAESLGERLGVVEISLATTGDRLDGLHSRFTVVDAKVDRLTERTKNSGGFSPDGSPVLFAGGRSAGNLKTPVPSLSLPERLDAEIPSLPSFAPP